MKKKKFDPGCLIIAILVIGIVGSIVAYAVYDIRRDIHNRIHQSQKIVQENDGKVTILYIYPSEYKNTINGHYAVAETVNTKQRLQLNTHTLPIPGEVWTLAANEYGNLYLKEKISK